MINGLLCGINGSHADHAIDRLRWVIVKLPVVAIFFWQDLPPIEREKEDCCEYGFTGDENLSKMIRLLNKLNCQAHAFKAKDLLMPLLMSEKI